MLGLIVPSLFYMYMYICTLSCKSGCVQPGVSSGGEKKSKEERNCCMCGVAAMTLQTGVEQEDVLYISMDNEVHSLTHIQYRRVGNFCWCEFRDVGTIHERVSVNTCGSRDGVHITRESFLVNLFLVFTC